MSYRISGVLVLLTALATNAHADGDRIALCVGINKYDDSGFQNREYAENDITAFATVLRDVGYRVVLMTTATGKTDPNLMPTKKNLDAQIEALIEKRNPNDLVVLAFIGHSLQFNKDPDCYFCPVDAKPSRDKTTTLVSLDRVYTQLGRCRAGAKVLLADYCQNDSDPTRNRGPNDVLEKVPPKDVFAFYACSSTERSYESKKLEHGVFFYHLLEGFKTVNNGNNDVEFMDLANVVLREVPKTVARLLGEGKKQNPDVKGPRLSLPVVLLARNDREILADYRAMEEWRRVKESSVGFYKENGPKRVGVWNAAAEQGSPKGMILYARCLQDGTGVVKDAVDAVKWLRKAAELGNAEAMNILGACYFTGTGIVKDAVEAAKWFRRAAELDNSIAMYNLGVCYQEATGVAKDTVEAVKWLRKAAELGTTEAMYNLGTCYYEGMGVAKDVAEAVKWFRKAAELGNAEAMVFLGGCYFNSMGVVKDVVEAAKWWCKAAELGNAEAMYNLGVCYRDGQGIAKDTVEAVKWFRKTAELGDSNAMYNLGVCYQEGTGVAKDTTEAAKWWRKAAELGNPMAIYNLGKCYYEGDGVAKDAVEAMKWFRKAAELGNPMAMHNLGVCYQEGTGVAKDTTEAAKWFRKAAELGNAEAMYGLGRCYFYGDGVKEDDTEAVKWFRKAAELGLIEAKTSLKQLGKE